MPAADPASSSGAALARARLVVGAMAALPVMGLALGAMAPVGEVAGRLVAPAALLGLISPAVGFRLHARRRERARGGPESRRRAFVGALASALSVTGVAAVLGAAVYGSTREIPALAGPAMHLLLAGALWPTADRLARLEEDASR